MKNHVLLGGFVSALLVLAGCVTTPPPALDNIVPLTDAEREAFFANARAPQMFGITVYSSEQGAVFGGAHRLHPGEVAILPFVDGRRTGVPLVSIDLGGRGAVTALIDTSAHDSWLAMSALERASYTPLAPPAYVKLPDHVYDDIKGMLCVVPRIKLADASVESAVMFVRAARGPLGAPARMLTRPAPEAVLGCSFLKAFSYVSLDFEHGIAILSATTGYLPDSKRLLANVPMVDTAHGITVELTREDEVRQYILDSGGDFDAVMKTPPAQPIRRALVGDLVLQQVRVEAAADKGLGGLDIPRIGRGILDRFLVTMDFRNKRVYFERPEEDRVLENKDLAPPPAKAPVAAPLAPAPTPPAPPPKRPAGTTSTLLRP